MNLKSLLLSVCALGVSLSSCNLDSDDENNYISGDYPCCNLVIPSDGDAFATYAAYNVSFYYYNGTAAISTNNLSLGYGSTGFTTNPMKSEVKLYELDGSNFDVTYFYDGQANNNGLVVQNLNGFLSSKFNVLSTNDPMNPAYVFTAVTPLVISYTVNHDYAVKTFMPDAIYSGTTNIHTVGSSAEPFTNDGVRYRVVFSDNLKKADIIFYNAKFASAMPVTVNFVLQNLDVAYNKTGYVISGKDITPLLFEGEKGEALTPAPLYQITDFEFINSSEDLTNGNAMYTVKIGQALYNGDFQGYYTLAPKEQ